MESWGAPLQGNSAVSQVRCSFLREALHFVASYIYVYLVNIEPLRDLY